MQRRRTMENTATTFWTLSPLGGQGECMRHRDCAQRAILKCSTKKYKHCNLFYFTYGEFMRKTSPSGWTQSLFHGFFRWLLRVPIMEAKPAFTTFALRVTFEVKLLFSTCLLYVASVSLCTARAFVYCFLSGEQKMEVKWMRLSLFFYPKKK